MAILATRLAQCLASAIEFSWEKKPARLALGDNRYRRHPSFLRTSHGEAVPNPIPPDRSRGAVASDPATTSVAFCGQLVVATEVLPKRSAFLVFCFSYQHHVEKLTRGLISHPASSNNAKYQYIRILNSNPIELTLPPPE